MNFSPATHESQSPTLIQSDGGAVVDTESAQLCVGQGRHSQTARRFQFLCRFIYWTWKHGTTKHAAWVCNYEGLYW